MSYEVPPAGQPGGQPFPPDVGTTTLSLSVPMLAKKVWQLLLGAPLSLSVERAERQPQCRQPRAPLALEDRLGIFPFNIGCMMVLMF